MHLVGAIVVALMLALAAAGPAAAAVRYTVAPHDTLYSIARRFEVPLALLVRANGIQDPSHIRVGEVLVIPDRPAGTTARGAVTRPAAPPDAGRPAAAAPPMPAAPMPAAPPDEGRPASLSSPRGASGEIAWAGGAGGESYIVQPGDTLYHLARVHGTTVGALQAANSLGSTALITGQVLRFPAPGPGTALPAIPQSGENAVRGLPVPGPWAPAAGRDRLNGATRRADLAARITASALRYIGTPYVWGGTSVSGVDCSGLVVLVYSPYVPDLPRRSYDQWAAGAAVDVADLAPGDLVFFNTDGTGASHVGIYIGDGRFVHPAAGAQRVTVDRLDAPYYAAHYLGARRVL